MGRAKNIASEEDLKKCLKGELDMLDPAKFNAAIEDVVDHYGHLHQKPIETNPKAKCVSANKGSPESFCEGRARHLQKLGPVQLQCNPALSQKAEEYEEWDEALSSCEVDM